MTPVEHTDLDPVDSIDYVRWLGIAAFTCGLSIPRRSSGLALVPGASPNRVTVYSDGGSAGSLAQTLEDIEREYTHNQWLLGGAPRDEAALDYVYHQELRVTRPPQAERAFTLVDFSDDAASDRRSDQERAYSPEASLEAARRLAGTTAGSRLAVHIPEWQISEPLGLIALAVREYFSGSVVRELTRTYARRLGDRPGRTARSLAYGRLAYSESSPWRPGGPPAFPPSTAAPRLGLHIRAEDPLFSEPAVRHLIERAQAFATVFGSPLDCREVFHAIAVHREYPEAIHEPDAQDIPITLYRIPLCADELPTWSFPEAVTDGAPPARGARTGLADDGARPSSRRGARVVLHRDPDSGVVDARRFIPGKELVDHAIQYGGYLQPPDVIAELQQKQSAVDPGCLAAHATPETIWGSMSTWGGAGQAAGAVRMVSPNVVAKVGDSVDRPLITIELDARAPLGEAVHDASDVLDALGIDPSMDFPIELAWPTEPAAERSLGGQTVDGSCAPETFRPQLPCLWPRALGARYLATTDRALALAAARRALGGGLPAGATWVGVHHSLHSPGEHHITAAVAYADGTDAERTADASGLADAITAVCAASFPEVEITCEVVDARKLPDPREWLTAAGSHPVFGQLPAFIQLERPAS